MSTYNNLNGTMLTSGMSFFEGASDTQIIQVTSPCEHLFDEDTVIHTIQHEHILHSRPEEVQIRRFLKLQSDFGTFNSEVSISLWLKVFIETVVYDTEARSCFMRNGHNLSIVPKILHDRLKSVRSSTCGRFVITTKVRSDIRDSYVALNLNQTVLNIDTLRTDAGMRKALHYIAMINSQCPSYIETITNQTGGIHYHAGEQTTFCSLSTDVSDDTITVMQHNSYPMGTPTTEHLAIAYINGVKHVDHEDIDVNTSMGKTIFVDRTDSIAVGHQIVFTYLGLPYQNTQVNDDTSPNPGPSPKPQREWRSRSKKSELEKKESKSIPQIVKAVMDIIDTYIGVPNFNKYYSTNLASYG